MRQIPDWDTYFMSMLEPISRRSKDPNTQFGCLIIGPDNNIRSTGYNSLPRGVRDDVPERFERPEKYLWIEHADRNAIYAAARIGVPLEGCTMYIGGIPCIDCARAIVQAGIVEVIYDANNQAIWEKRTPKFADVERTQTLFKEADVKLTPWYGQPDHTDVLRMAPKKHWWTGMFNWLHIWPFA